MLVTVLSARRKNRAPPPPAEAAERRPRFSKQFLSDLHWWAKHQAKVHARLLRLVEATLASPFQGIGKPEPLKHTHQGLWSRRLTKADRVVYKVTDDTVEFASARFHYPEAE